MGGVSPGNAPIRKNYGLVYVNKYAERKDLARTSRCCTPLEGIEPPFYYFHSYIDERHPDVVSLNEWLRSQGVTPYRRQRIVGKIRTVLNAACHAQLDPDQDGELIKKGMKEHPKEMFELRWDDVEKAEKHRVLIRLYHAEPPDEDFDDLLIATHIHLKYEGAADGAVEDDNAQEEAIRQGIRRYRNGSRSGWDVDAGIFDPAAVHLFSDIMEEELD